MDDELKAILDKLLRGQEEAKGDVATVAQQLLNLADDTHDMRAALIERFEKGQTELRTVMMERFERVEDKLTNMSTDMSVNIMATNNDQRIRIADRKEVTDLFTLVLEMREQMLRMRTDIDELKRAS